VAPQRTRRYPAQRGLLSHPVGRIVRKDGSTERCPSGHVRQD